MALDRACRSDSYPDVSNVFNRREQYGLSTIVINEVFVWSNNESENIFLNLEKHTH